MTHTLRRTAAALGVLGACLGAATTADAAPRIVGGQASDISAFPSTVSIGTKEAATERAAHYCGGTLILAQWVLTAAHCFDGDNGMTVNEPQKIQVLAGVSALSTTTNNRAVGVTELIVREGYPGSGENLPGGPNDIALLKLSTPIVSSPTVALPVAGDNEIYAPGRHYTVAGWGSVKAVSSEEGALEPQLKKLAVVGKADAECGGPPFDAALELCTKLLAGTPTPSSSCQGDSGGPLYARTANNTLVIAGVVSRGPTPCTGANDDEGTYGETRAFRTWIEGKVGAPLPVATITPPLPPQTTPPPAPTPTPSPTPTPTPTPIAVQVPTAVAPRPAAFSAPAISARTRVVSRRGRLSLTVGCKATPCKADIRISQLGRLIAQRSVVLTTATRKVTFTPRRPLRSVRRKLPLRVSIIAGQGASRTVTTRSVRLR